MTILWNETRLNNLLKSIWPNKHFCEVELVTPLVVTRYRKGESNPLCKTALAGSDRLDLVNNREVTKCEFIGSVTQNWPSLFNKKIWINSLIWSILEISNEQKSMACDDCVDYWDCVGNCTSRKRQKRSQLKVDDQLLLKDLKEWRKNSLEVFYFVIKI